MSTQTRGAPVTPFLSKHCLLATRSLTDTLMALAVIGLPLEVPPERQADVAVVDGCLRFAAREPMVVFYRDMASVPEPAGTTVLVGQNYFDPTDRYTLDR